MHSVTDIIRIVSAGGGLILDSGHFSTEELIRIASASRNKGTKITLTDLHSLSVTDLIRIAAAGEGNVVFSL